MSQCCVIEASRKELMKDQLNCNAITKFIRMRIAKLVLECAAWVVTV